MLEETTALAQALGRVRRAPVKIDWQRRLVGAVDARAAAEAIVRGGASPAETEVDEKLFQRLGLLAAGASYLNRLAGAVGRNPVGFYDPSSRRLSVPDFVSLPEQRPTLAHEIAHAYQDQRFGLRRFVNMGTLGGFPNPLATGSGGGPAYAQRVKVTPDGRRGLSFDEQLARQALVEGDASVLSMEGDRSARRVSGAAGAGGHCAARTRGGCPRVRRADAAVSARATGLPLRRGFRVRGARACHRELGRDRRDVGAAARIDDAGPAPRRNTTGGNHRSRSSCRRFRSWATVCASRAPTRSASSCSASGWRPPDQDWRRIRCSRPRPRSARPPGGGAIGRDLRAGRGGCAAGAGRPGRRYAGARADRRCARLADHLGVGWGRRRFSPERGSAAGGAGGWRRVEDRGPTRHGGSAHGVARTDRRLGVRDPAARHGGRAAPWCP